MSRAVSGVERADDPSGPGELFGGGMMPKNTGRGRRPGARPGWGGAVVGAVSESVSCPDGLRPSGIARQGATPVAPFAVRGGGPNLSGWTMIEVFDTTAACRVLVRRQLRCPDCAAAVGPGPPSHGH
jgi:hypothetical protein